MRVFYVFFLVVFCPSLAMGQINLVPNPSFEDTTNCQGFSNFNSSFPWFNPNIATPDYYYGSNPSCGYSAINNPSGHQSPHSGISYAGLYLYSGITREYIEIKLLDSLLTNRTYNVQFYVSKANQCLVATSSIGGYLSKTPILDTNTLAAPNFPFVPTFENAMNNVLYDTTNWIKLSFSLIASGGEQYFTIGNFLNNANSVFDTVPVTGNFFSGSYYYIDDISIVLDTLTNVVTNSTFNGNIYLENIDNVLYLKSPNDLINFNYSLYDLNGRLLQENKIISNITIIDISTYSKGYYIVKVDSKKFIKHFKFFKT